MKLIPRFITILLATTIMAHSQVGDSSVSSESATISDAPIAARILGNIPDGTPPPIAPPKQKYQVAKQDVLSTATHQQGGRTITMRQIKPINLPQPPAPVLPAPGKLEAEFSKHVSEYHDNNPKSDIIFLGATVFRAKSSPPKTLVRYWPVGGKEITFWTTADFAYIAGGINSFEDAVGDTHTLIIGWSNVDIDRISDVKNSVGYDFEMPELPIFEKDESAFRIIGEQPTAEDLAPIQALHDIYNNQLSQLKTAFHGRERARIESEEYLKAHPPQPKDITLNFWRTEKPATEEKGGGK